jgi:hypothetical protein
MGSNRQRIEFTLFLRPRKNVVDTGCGLVIYAWQASLSLGVRSVGAGCQSCPATLQMTGEKKKK